MAGSLISSSRQGRRRHRGRRAMGEINVTPMVDIMSVLLFIFMITAPLLTTGIPLDLPRAKSENMEGSDKALNISVDVEGRYYIGKEEVTLENVVPKLKAMVANNPELRVVISADKGTPYGKVIEMMGILKFSGFTKVGLQTEHRTEAAINPKGKKKK